MEKRDKFLFSHCIIRAVYIIMRRYIILCYAISFLYIIPENWCYEKKIVTKITKKKVAFGGIHNSMDYSEKKEKKNIAYT